MWILSRILEKVFSARFILTVFFGLSYCISIFCSMYLVVINKMEITTFLGIFSGFAGTTGAIVTSYFSRTDRESSQTPSKTV